MAAGAAGRLSAGSPAQAARAGSCSPSASLLIPAAGAWFGAYPGHGNTDPASFEAPGMANRKLDVWTRFYQLATVFPTSDDVTQIQGGRYLNVCLTPSFTVGQVTWAQVAAGAQDARLNAIAAGIAALPGPVFLGWDNEPDISARNGSGSPADYVASYQHVSNLMRASAGGNAVMCWVVSSGSSKSASMYPGDAYVDWIGADPYDPSLAKGSPLAAYSPFMTWLSQQSFGAGKPVGIFETGVDDTVPDASEAAWIARVPADLSSLGYKMWLWFNSGGTLGNCTIVPGSQSAAALAAAGAASFFNQAHV